MSRYRDLTGQRFGKLEVIAYAGRTTCKRRLILWTCLCDCGGEKTVRATDLTRNMTQSCGCKAKEQRRNAAKAQCHPYSETNWPREYSSWKHMKSRCYSHKDPTYYLYGARGIRVCQRWLNSFQAFVTDMGKAPEGYTLERASSNGDYTPENCKWASQKEQANNTSRNVFLTKDGQTLTVAQWAEKLGVPCNTIHQRLYRGWTHDQALTFYA